MNHDTALGFAHGAKFNNDIEHVDVVELTNIDRLNFGIRNRYNLRNFGPRKIHFNSFTDLEIIFFGVQLPSKYDLIRSSKNIAETLSTYGVAHTKVKKSISYPKIIKFIDCIDIIFKLFPKLILFNFIDLSEIHEKRKSRNSRNST